MINIDKITIQVLLNDKEENYCAKCCKTRNIMERMMEEIPMLKQKTWIQYEDISSKEMREKYGNLIPPAIIINNNIYSEGHVPIIKKLSKSIIELITK